MRVVIVLSVVIAFGMVPVLIATAQAQDFKVCDGTFALCTIAPCDPIPGNDKKVACHCTVNQSYSAGQQPCQGVKDTRSADQVALLSGSQLCGMLQRSALGLVP